MLSRHKVIKAAGGVWVQQSASAEEKRARDQRMDAGHRAKGLPTLALLEEALRLIIADFPKWGCWRFHNIAKKRQGKQKSQGGGAAKETSGKFR